MAKKRENGRLNFSNCKFYPPGLGSYETGALGSRRPPLGFFAHN